MSHSLILVIGEDVEKQMAPFQESSNGNCPDEYIKFCACTCEGDQIWFNSEEQAIEKLGNTIDKDGSYWGNPNGIWDSYLIGGRCTGYFKLTPGASGEVGEPGFMTPKAELGYADSCTKSSIDIESMKDGGGEGALCAPSVLKDGKLYECGETGWWCAVSDEDNDSVWVTELTKLIDSLPEDTLLTIVDAHI